MTIGANQAEDTNLTRSWRLHGAALALLVTLILIEFRGAVSAAVEVWWIYPTYSHCFLIIPISLWLIWERRNTLQRTDPKVEPRALILIVPVLLLWWLGELSTINEVRQIGVVALIEIAILTMVGVDVYRAILFPALYLFFLVPTGEYLIAPMQRLATYFTDGTLSLIGIPHFTEGTLIELTNGNFEIAEACAGLRFLIATVTLGILFAHLTFRKWYKIVLFLLSCIIIPLVGNGLRIVGVILLAHFTDNKYGAGADHIVYGWGFNVAILLVLFLLGSLFRDPVDETAPVDAPAGNRDSTARLAGILAASIVLISAGPAVALWHDSRAINPDAAGLSRPLRIADGRIIPLTSNWHPIFPGVDAEMSGSLVSSALGEATPVDFFVAYYVRARTGHAVSDTAKHLWNSERWSLDTSDSVQATLGKSNVRMQEYIVISVAGKRLIWSCYWVDGQLASSLLGVKLLQTKAAFGGHEGEAVIAVSTPITGTEEEARARLRDGLAELKDIPDRLDAANGRHGANSN